MLHQVKGYRYLEEENSDESDSEKSEDEVQQQDDEEGPGTEEEEVREDDGDATSLGSQHSPRPHGRRRRQRHQVDAYEQAGAREEYA